MLKKLSVNEGNVKWKQDLLLLNTLLWMWHFMQVSQTTGHWSGVSLSVNVFDFHQTLSWPHDFIIKRFAWFWVQVEVMVGEIVCLPLWTGRRRRWPCRNSPLSSWRCPGPSAASSAPECSPWPESAERPPETTTTHTHTVALVLALYHGKTIINEPNGYVRCWVPAPTFTHRHVTWHSILSCVDSDFTNYTFSGKWLQ